MNIVLFNKDLRISDHQPLAEAAALGEVLPLYVFVPSQWNETPLSARHLQFVVESLDELSKGIEDKGGKLFAAIDEVEKVLEGLMEIYDSINIYAHKDGGRFINKVKKWADQNQQSLVCYGPELVNIPGKLFNDRLISYLKESQAEVPDHINVPSKSPGFLSTDIKKIQTFNVKGKKIRFGQQGGEWKALETLDSFLGDRFTNYIENYPKPLSSSFSSSRLSAYITWGNISIRTIFQRTDEKLQACELEEDKVQLEEFLSKLTTRAKICSLRMQDQQPADVNEVKSDYNEEWFRRWFQGRTGIPMIDAAMRSLDKTGWMNFSLRSMVTSFIANTLLLEEHKVSAALAGLYLDYEPAVHDFYIQQQKIIDPVKAGRRLDPDGTFIRRYVPELSNLPDEYIHEPWLYPGFYQLGYEAPMVDVKKMYKHAKLQHQTIKSNGKRGRKKEEGETEQLSFDF